MKIEHLFMGEISVFYLKITNFENLILSEANFKKYSTNMNLIQLFIIICSFAYPIFMKIEQQFWVKSLVFYNENHKL